MLTQICQELHNWFNYSLPKNIGDHVIENGVLVDDCGLLNGQYFRIVGSVLNDGVYQYPASGLQDERFHGGIWSMAVPPDVVQLAEDIKDWQDKYGGTDSVLMSPFTSESFGGYSYSKAGGGASDGKSSAGTWQAAFRSRLNQWRKLPPW